MLEKGNWDLKDKSTRPKNIQYKITDETKDKIIKIRKRTGWCGAIVKDISISLNSRRQIEEF